MGWGRTRARSLARAGARAAGTGDAALPGSAAPPVGAQRVHSVPQSTRWPRAARSTLRLMRRRTECAPRWQGSEPEQRGRRASIKFRQSTIPAAATRWAMLCRAIRTATQWRVAARTPAARVGLHQTLANSRETIHTIPRNALARARPAPILQLEPAAHGRRDFRNTGPRAAARPEPLAVPSTHWARRRPAAPAVGPRRRSRLAARALDRFATNMPAQTPSGARVAALQQARAARLETAPPLSAFSHVLLHVWSPRCALRKRTVLLPMHHCILFSCKSNLLNKPAAKSLRKSTRLCAYVLRRRGNLSLRRRSW